MLVDLLRSASKPGAAGSAAAAVAGFGVRRREPASHLVGRCGGRESVCLTVMAWPVCREEKIPASSVPRPAISACRRGLPLCRILTHTDACAGREMHAALGTGVKYACSALGTQDSLQPWPCHWPDVY